MRGKRTAPAFTSTRAAMTLMREIGVRARNAITALIFGTRAATLTSANGATTK